MEYLLTCDTMLFYRQTVDHLGFAIETESDFKLYEKSQADYLRILAKRSGRWKSMIRLNEHKLNPAKCKYPLLSHSPL